MASLWGSPSKKKGSDLGADSSPAPRRDTQARIESIEIVRQSDVKAQDAGAMPAGNSGSGDDGCKPLKWIRERIEQLKERSPELFAFVSGCAVGAIFIGGTILLSKAPGAIRGKSRGCKRRRGPTVKLVVQEGETLGDLLVRYVGDYSDTNLAQVRRLNRGLTNLDLILPGDELVLPDNRSIEDAELPPQAFPWTNQGQVETEEPAAVEAAPPSASQGSEGAAPEKKQKKKFRAGKASKRKDPPPTKEVAAPAKRRWTLFGGRRKGEGEGEQAVASKAKGKGSKADKAPKAKAAKAGGEEKKAKKAKASRRSGGQEKRQKEIKLPQDKW